MTAFGWFTVGLWIFITIGVVRGGNNPLATVLSWSMIVGTLVWGTGSL